MEQSDIKVFSEEEMAAWHEQGWIILREAVPPEQCAQLVDAIFRQLRQDPDDPTTWYPRAYPQRTLLHHPREYLMPYPAPKA